MFMSLPGTGGKIDNNRALFLHDTTIERDGLDIMLLIMEGMDITEESGQDLGVRREYGGKKMTKK